MKVTDFLWQKRLVLLHALMLISVSGMVSQQRVGIGTSTPATTLNLIGPGSNPAMPGFVSSGIFRVGVAGNEGLDMGKMTVSPFSAWMQSGYDGNAADPLSLQPLGGSVGIGTAQPYFAAALDVHGVNKGMLIPRGGATTRVNLGSNTGKGLMMYDSITGTIWHHTGNGSATGWKSVANGTNHWTLNGALGTEIANTNSGGFWSANATAVLSPPGIIQPPVSGPGTRLMWMPAKSAFRACTTGDTTMDANNIGSYSFATGVNTIAKGNVSIAMGNLSKATGENSIALGFNNTASNLGSIAMGDFCTSSGISSFATGWVSYATGNYSTAFGRSKAIGIYSTSAGADTRARGAYSTSLGHYTICKGYASTVVGMYNDSILTVDQSAYTPTTPLFIVGNGDGNNPGERKNAMVIRKDGRIGLGTSLPINNLTLIGNAGNPTIPGTASTGMVRLGLNASEGIDIGKMTSGSFAGWIQVGIDGTLADPLSLQPAGGRVGVGTTSPATSAVLDVASTNKGFLPPRMTLANRNSIASPTAGLMIWCTNCGAYGQMQIYNGDFWSNLTGSPAVGTPEVGVHDGGGIIAYLLQAGDPGYIAGETHGLIVTVNDIAVSATWGCSGTNLPGAAGTALGTGQQNTTDIVNGCGSTGIGARLCNDLVQGGYSDWYLPSKDELNKMYLNQVAIGGFSGDWYWSSSESSATQAWHQDFSAGTQAVQNKTFAFRVRGMRTF